MAWLLLCVTIVLEVAGTILLKISDGPTQRPWVFAASLACYWMCFWTVSLVFRTIPFTIVYAIWAGVGTALVVLVGVLWFREPMSVMKLVFLGMIAVGTVGLKFMSNK